MSGARQLHMSVVVLFIRARNPAHIQVSLASITLSPCAANSLSSSNCLDHFPPDFSFRRHIS